MADSKDRRTGTFGMADPEAGGIGPKPEEGVFVSPWGTEGCQWELDYSYLEDDDPPEAGAEKAEEGA